MPTLETYEGEYLWNYVPNLPLAIIFAVLFGVATAAHSWRLARTRLWFCLPFAIGGLFEIVGYASRAGCSNATGFLGPYLIQAIFLILSPVLFAATLYMAYSRVVRAVDGARFSPVSPRWTTWIFVISDWTCFNIQGNGGGLLAKPKLVSIGNAIIVAGLMLQILVFLCFITVCLAFHKRFGRHLAETGAQSNVPWRSCFGMLYATSVAILVRNLYRVVEFTMGKNGYLQRVEWPTYVFDAALMLLVMIAFFVWYPSKLQPTTSRESMVELMSDPGNIEERVDSETTAGTGTRIHAKRHTVDFSSS